MNRAFIILCFTNYAAAFILPKDIDDNINNLSTLEIAEKYGYPTELHKVQTDDGYILTLHRIPYGRHCDAQNSKGPVLLQHGLLCSSADWVLMGPEKGLGFILADRCYDVWMGNSRGNYYSREHTHLNVKHDKFWDFSWHEMGVNDVPAVIDYVLNVTEKSNLFYVGHSQGTTEFFIFNEFYPEYENKVKAMFAMAPIAYLGHSHSLVLQFIAHFQTIANWISKFIGLNEFLPTDGFISQVGQALCKESHPLFEGICSNIMFLGCGFDSEQLNKTALPAILAHTPAGASTKQFLHFAQSLNTGDFRHFDHGVIKNLIKYGSIRPPKYHLDKVTIPVYLFYSKNDWLAAVKDVRKLKRQLKNVIGEYLIPFEKFNHLDYLWANDVDTLVYNKLIEEMDKLV